MWYDKIVVRLFPEILCEGNCDSPVFLKWVLIFNDYSLKECLWPRLAWWHILSNFCKIDKCLFKYVSNKEPVLATVVNTDLYLFTILSSLIIVIYVNGGMWFLSLLSIPFFSVCR